MTASTKVFLHKTTFKHTHTHTHTTISWPSWMCPGQPAPER